MASDSDINLLTVVGRINLKYVRDIKNTTIINKLNQYLDIHAGLNINKQRQSDFCKLQYVLSRGKSHGMESCKQMGRSNFYQQSHLEKIRNLLEKDVDIKEVTVLVKSIDKELVTNGSYVIIANLPHGVKSSNQGFLNTGKILLIKYGDNSGVEWYTIYNNKDSNDKTAISLEKKAEYITNKIKSAPALPAVQPQAAPVLPAPAAPALPAAPAPPAVQPQAAPAPPAVQPQAAPADVSQQQQAAQQQVVNVKKLTTKADTLHELQSLKNTLPQRGVVQRGFHMDRDKHNQAKQDLIKAVNNEIINYNEVFPDSQIEIIKYNDIDKINQATIIAQISDKINQIKGKKGGKSTRRRRRKMNPTQKKTHKKPKTKKKSKRGALKKRKTRSKK
jgi:hypothetical protein